MRPVKPSKPFLAVVNNEDDLIRHEIERNNRAYCPRCNKKLELLMESSKGMFSVTFKRCCT